MNDWVVVGLFESKGEADNARARLVTEGIAPADILERVLHDVSLAPKAMDPELHSGFFSELRRNYQDYIKNGETVLTVRAGNEANAEAVESILMMFVPVRVDRMLTPESLR